MNCSATFSPAANKTRALYVHIPFCRHRCGYCNFSLLAGRNDLIDRFLCALEKEIGWIQGRHAVKTVFLGGGTPSQLNRNQLERVFEILRSRFDISPAAEISAECNPNDFDEKKAESFYHCGINRISFGVQSFNESKLKFLERSHTQADIEMAVQLARQFTDNVSFDLIFGTQNESLDDWMMDCNKAADLNPNHVSTYELTIEKGTSFWNRQAKRMLKVPDEDQRSEFYQATIEFLNSKRFEQYEISSFSQPGFRCRHNQSYWNGDDYFAFGPGAARYIDGIRELNHRSTTTYIKKLENDLSPTVEQESLTKHEQAIERIVFGLRQIDGIGLADFQLATGLDAIELMGKPAKKLFAESLIELNNGHCRLTEHGLMLYDSICQAIVNQD